MATSANSTLFLVDGSSLAFRSFYALITSGMRNLDGMPTWAVYGFFSSLFETIDKFSPHSLAICFDLAEPTFRHQEFDDYKANRQEMPDDLASQWPEIKRGVETFSIPVYELAGYEADDLIGTVATTARQRGLDVAILTGDQDSFQLLSQEGIQVLMPTRDGLKIYKREEVFEKLGIWPEQVVDYKGLCGDASDNIPGVRGIGPKTAVQLLSQFGTLENTYEHLNEIKSNSVRTKLQEGRENAFKSQNLARIILDVDFDFDFDHCRLTPPDTDRVIDFMQQMGFKAFLKRLPKILTGFNGGVEPQIDAAKLAPAKKPAMVQTLQASGFSSGALAERPMQLSLLEQPEQTVIEARDIAPVTTKIISNQRDLSELLRSLEAAGSFAIDMQASGSHDNPNLLGLGFCWGIPFGLQDGRLQTASGEAKPQGAFLPCGRAGEVAIPTSEILRQLKPLLENRNLAKMGFDSKQIIKIMTLADIDCPTLQFDPLLASYIANPADQHKLQDQAERLLGVRLLDLTDITGQGKKALPLEMLPNSQLAPCSAENARASLELAGRYLKLFDEDQRELLWGMDLPVAGVLARLELAGVSISTNYFKSLGTELTAELARLEGEIHVLAGHEFNVGSPLQLQKVLFEQMKLPAKVRTKSGYSTDASVLEELADDHEIVRKVLEWRQVSKLAGTYVESLPRQLSARDGKLHGEFNQASTATGRLSSSNPNLQNIPIRSELGRRIRRGFVASDDKHQLISADYSQIELRFLAHMSGDENLIAAFASGQDIHVRTAMLIFDTTAEAVTKEQRGVGKTLNFALIYQQGAYATGKSLGITTKEAQAFTEKYFKSFPRVRAFMSRVLDEARESGYVQTLWGRRRYFNNLNDRNDGVRKADERAAFNAPLQGSAADLMKLAMIRLDKELREKGMQSKLILQVHDELVMDVPDEEVEAAKDLLERSMSMDQPLSVPLGVDVGVGSNWMDAK